MRHASEFCFLKILFQKLLLQVLSALLMPYKGKILLESFWLTNQTIK